MLTIQEIQSLLTLISSDKLTITGREALAVATLQVKLSATIKAASQPKAEKPSEEPSPAA